jgi:hypothetical protein
MRIMTAGRRAASASAPAAERRRLDAPGDADDGVVPAHRDFIGRAVEFIAFVEKIRRFRQHREAVGKAARHPHLAAVLLAQFDGDVAAEGRAADADIDRDIEHAAAQHGDELALGPRILQMQAAQHPTGGARQVVLHERTANSRGGVTIRPEGFDKKAAMVAEHFGLDDQHFGDCGANDVHAAAETDPFAPNPLRCPALSTNRPTAQGAAATSAFRRSLPSTLAARNLRYGDVQK